MKLYFLWLIRTEVNNLNILFDLNIMVVKLDITIKLSKYEKDKFFSKFFLKTYEILLSIIHLEFFCVLVKMETFKLFTH
jgi:hypothetical protein